MTLVSDSAVIPADSSEKNPSNTQEEHLPDRCVCNEQKGNGIEARHQQSTRFVRC